MKLVQWMSVVVAIGFAQPLAAQAVAPREVVTSAVESVEALGKQVVLGNHKVAIEKMYPQWKERMAKRRGGIEKLEEELEGIGGMMARNGVNIISFKTQGAPRVYEVWPGKDAGGANAGQPVFTKWMMLVPTVMQIRIMQGDDPKGHVINLHGFQIAISEKGRQDWTFINGSDVTVADLRSLFPALPANMELPEVRREAAE